MPNYSDYDWQKLVDTLTDLGSCMGTFNQTRFNKNARQQDRVDEVLGQSLGDGYCAGVVTDWARRVLLSNAQRNPAFLSYRYEGDSADAKTDRAVQRMGTAYADQITQLPWTSRVGEDQATMRETSWQAHTQRVGQREPKVKRPFQSLQALDSRRATYDTPDRWVAAVVGGPTAQSPIRTGCVAKLGFSDPGEIGHAVAIWRRRENTSQSDAFYFFDPNFGVFAYGLPGLESALRILFAHPHPNIRPPQEKNIPYYRDCARYAATQMSYIILGPPNVVDVGFVAPVQPVQPTVQHQPQVVQPTPRPNTAPVLQPSPPINVPQPRQPAQPTNLYGGGNRGTPSPGNLRPEPATMTAPETSPSGALSKADLQALHDDAQRYTYAFKGQQGGYVKLDAQQAEKIRQAGPAVWNRQGFQWSASSIVEQPAGQFRHAILKSTLKKLIDWM